MGKPAASISAGIMKSKEALQGMPYSTGRFKTMRIGGRGGKSKSVCAAHAWIPVFY